MYMGQGLPECGCMRHDRGRMASSQQVSPRAAALAQRSVAITRQTCSRFLITTCNGTLSCIASALLMAFPTGDIYDKAVPEGNLA